MKRMMLGVVALTAMFGTEARAQTAPAAVTAHATGDIAGDWQGTINPGTETRIVIRIAKADKGWSGTMFLLLDQGSHPVSLSGVALSGSTLKFSADSLNATFEGRVSPDGNSIMGEFNGGPKPKMPATLVRSTRETAWEIPEPPAAPKLMAADADPSFEVTTIKPNISGAASLQQLTINGRDFTIRNGSLVDLIAFAYNVQKKQIVDGPSWMDADRYDIAAVPDVEGAPNVEQLRTMVRKLITDRYQLTFHHEKRELAAFVLTVGKTGQKLTASAAKGSLPNIGARPAANGLTLVLQNGTLTDFTSFLQFLVLDRPVVDQTGVVGRYDFSVTFTPDDSQFNGHPPIGSPPAEGTELAPDLYSAIEQQLGMKLSAEKTQVDVMAIDHVEKPSPN